jgi:hypothetical protein
MGFGGLRSRQGEDGIIRGAAMPKSTTSCHVGVQAYRATLSPHSRRIRVLRLFLSSACERKEPPIICLSSIEMFLPSPRGIRTGAHSAEEV